MQKIIIGVVVVVLIIAGAWALMNNNANTPEQTSPTTDTSAENTNTNPSTESDTSLLMEEAAQTYTIDSEASTLGWHGEKVFAGGHDGAVTISEGTVYVDESGTISGGEFTIDMDSITNEDLSGAMKDQLLNHLRSDDFFSVAQYPDAEFTITSVTETATDNDYQVVGDLTIKGITNEISFPATITMPDGQMLVTAEFSINRSLWDIRFGSASFFEDLGDSVISDDIDLTLDLVLEQN